MPKISGSSRSAYSDRPNASAASFSPIRNAGGEPC